MAQANRRPSTSPMARTAIRRRSMKRPAMRSSQRGLLLVEAVLSAVIIATGLVLITRGLAGQLKALRSIEEYDTLISLAQGKLLELEGKRLFAYSLLAVDRMGTFEDPYEAYRWTIEATVRAEPKDAEGRPLANAVTILVQRTETPTLTVRLS